MEPENNELPICIGTGMVEGVEGVLVTVEATLRDHTGQPRILGHVDAIVRESFHRVLAAFAASGVPSPRGCATLNFAPAGLLKSGAFFDLPMALALAGAAGHFPRARARELCAYGELALRGTLLRAHGAVAIALAARARGRTLLLAAPDDAAQMALVPGVRAIPVQDLTQAVLFLRGELSIEPALPVPIAPPTDALDLADIRGHETPKRALLVAAAGGHNLLLVGPPGSGKTALARRLPGLLPRPTEPEALEILRIHTLARGTLPRLERPLRAPHHSSSTASILGGGSTARPGEATLAHRGLLFLDELPEFPRGVLEGLREPLEERQVTIGRAKRCVTLPADFQLVAAMNPCPCGWLGHPFRPCLCTPPARARYTARISGPMLDRLDLQVEVPSLPPSVLSAPPDPGWSTPVLRAKVEVARVRQLARSHHLALPGWNGRLAGAALDRAAAPSPKVLAALERALHVRRLSGRARVRILRVARTIADLDDRDDLVCEDVLEAVELRVYERLRSIVP